jgi:hypothetical protein
MGVMHADEIDYVFGHPTNLSKDYTKNERELSRQIMNYFATFAKTGLVSFFKTRISPIHLVPADELKKINKFLASRPFLSCRYLGVSIEAVDLRRSNEIEIPLNRIYRH